MKLRQVLFKRMILVCVIILVTVALVVALGVIPPVKADTYPRANPEKAALGFWISISLNLLVAFKLLFIAIKSKSHSWKSTSVIVIVGFIILLLGLALIDAGSSFQKHGPSMEFASILLFICAGVEILSGVAVITAAFLRENNT